MGYLLTTLQTYGTPLMWNQISKIHCWKKNWIQLECQRICHTCPPTFYKKWSYDTQTDKTIRTVPKKHSSGRVVEYLLLWKVGPKRGCLSYLIEITCSDIISPYQKMTSKEFPFVLPIWTNLWVFFKIPKIQKSYNIHAIFLRLVWWSKRWR